MIEGQGKTKRDFVGLRKVVTPMREHTARATRYLPDSWELDGAGMERIIVVLSDQAIDVESAVRAARAAYEKAGRNLARMPSLDLPGEQFVRTFAKP